jgi:hypothetical protein
MNKKLVDLIKILPSPKAAWLALEMGLLNDSDDKFILGGAILETVPENKRGNPKIISAIYEIAEIALERYQSIYKGLPSEWNNHRLQVRKSVFGWLL